MSSINKPAGSSGLLIIIMVLILAGIGIYAYRQNKTVPDNTASKQMTGKEKDLALTSETDIMADKKTDEAMPAKDESAIGEKMADKKDQAMIAKTGSYLDYSAANFAANQDKKRVLYFHAQWCPICKVANADFQANLDKIPADVVLLKTDYDTEGTLKKQYGVTYQHTFVLVDAAGNALKKWNGGGINELIANTL